PAAELEVYRFGPERDARRDPRADLAIRMGQGGAADLETAGVIDSRFGPVSLMRPAGASEGPRACLGFLKTIAEPALRISGWSCQGVTMPTRRAMVGCMLNRLTLLAPEQDRALGQLFAGPEPRRGGCDAPATAGSAGDWVMSTANPRLRGAL
ncbi:MAG: hypothetical protein E6531_15490, partial [Bradyrhizobium sp.]|nr:hypothetical protein [Bradyrhizobium sp.]